MNTNHIYNMLNFLVALNNCNCKKIAKEEDEPTSKCDIIDIANEEMKNIDSTEIDSEFKKVFIGQKTQNILDLINEGFYTQDDIDSYLKALNNKNIKDLRVAGKFLYVKTTKNIIPFVLAEIMNIDEQCIEKVPINGKYNFYLIDSDKWSSESNIIEETKPIYDPEDFVAELKDIGSGNEDYEERMFFFDILEDALTNSWEDRPQDADISIDIENQVVAIAINQYIPNAKQTLSEVLYINPILFTEVSTPLGTVLLIDTRRWYLEPNFGDEEWFH